MTRIPSRICQQYTNFKRIGHGAYGQVYSADHESGKKVAIKKVKPFDHSTTSLRTLREIILLRHFDHENIIALFDIQTSGTLESFSEIYIIQDLMGTDLYQVIRSQQLSPDHCQYFTYQILRALKAIHSANVMHRDLKPSNLLVNENCDLKVCDFGLARFVTNIPEKPSLMTEYVVTRWYRAPEVMIDPTDYTKAIDMWSVGCILAEMLTGEPLFPGKDYVHQFNLILDVVGTSSVEDYCSIKLPRSRQYIESLTPRSKIPWKAIFPEVSDVALDFLDKLLTFNPNKRITVEEALKHPYMETYHYPEDEPIADPIPPERFEFEQHKDETNNEYWRSKLAHSVLHTGKRKRKSC